MYKCHLPDPAEMIGAMVQVGSQGEEEEELVAMMKAIVVEGIDPIRDRRLINAMWLMPPNCLLVVRGLWEQGTCNSFAIYRQKIPLHNPYPIKGGKRKI